MDIELIFSKERNTWNVFYYGEWYYETNDYEDALRVYDNLWASDYLVN